MLLTEKRDDEQRQKYEKIEKQMRIWRVLLWKGSQIRKVQKNLEDIERFPTIEEFKLIENSEHSRQGKYLLDRFKVNGAMELTSKRFAHMRDYLLLNIGCDNATRTGGIINMKLGEYKRRKISKDDPLGYTVSAADAFGEEAAGGAQSAKTDPFAFIMKFAKENQMSFYEAIMQPEIKKLNQRNGTSP